MKWQGPLFWFVSLISIAHAPVTAQTPNPMFSEETLSIGNYEQYGHLKDIPQDMRSQVLIALSFYPELRNTKIILRYRKRRTPLSSRPRVWSTFRKKKNRTYVITISIKSNQHLMPILFSNLPYNTQIGVIGHELSHISAYRTQTSGQLLGLYTSLLKSKNVDAFEFSTDSTCIAHGLGHQLLAWSSYVRNALDIPEWRGAPKSNYQKKSQNMNLRYMNPATIKNHMDKNPIYNDLPF